MGSKKRGSGTHGHGSSKKRRGAGNRGGRGRAGLGKKAKHKKIQAKKKGGHLGEKGFTRPQKTVEETVVINLRDIDQRIDEFVAQGYAEESGNGYVFDAEEAGFDKVLGTGRLTKSIDIKAAAFSSVAQTKIEDAGNQAILTEDAEPADEDSDESSDAASDGEAAEEE